MNLLNIFGILLDVSLLMALVLSIKRWDKLVSKNYLIFLVLSIVCFLTLVLGGPTLRAGLLRFQNGLAIYAGMIWIVITMILSLAINLHWVMEWYSNRGGWDEGRKKKNFPLIWLIALLVFFISFYYYSQQIGNDMDNAMGNRVNMNLPGSSPMNRGR
jgi:hypothetical protein